MAQERKKMGEILISKGLIDRHQLKSALHRQQEWPNQKIGEILVSLGFMTEENLVKVLSEHFKVPAIDLDKFQVDPKVIQMIKADFCKQHCLIPISIRKIKGADKMVIATTDPTDFTALDELRFMVGIPIAVAIAATSSIKKAIQAHYFGQGNVDRDEITITRTIKPEDAVMEILRDGNEEKIVLHNMPQPTPGTMLGPTVGGALRELLYLLEEKGVLSAAEAQRVLSKIV